MKQFKATRLALIILATLIVPNGCSVLSPQPDRTRYFVLAAQADANSIASTGAVTGGRALTVGLGPITVPRYLDRPEVVTRLTDTELSVSDTERWGEPLGTSVSRVLQQDLSNDLPGSQIVSFPWSRKTPIDYRVTVDFQRLERAAGGTAEVQASWTIRNGVDNALVQTGTATASASAGSDERSTSAALSRGIAEIGRQIAQQLDQQPHAHADTH